MYFNELSYDSFGPPKFFPATISGLNEEPNPSSGTPPPTDFGSKVLKLCLHAFSSILKVQPILRTTSAILNYVNLIILTYSLQAQNSTSTVNDDSDYSFLSRFFFSPFFWKTNHLTTFCITILAVMIYTTRHHRLLELDDQLGGWMTKPIPLGNLNWLDSLFILWFSP